MLQLFLATHNPHKTREFIELLGNTFQVRDLSGSAISAVEEAGTSFEENAISKALSLSRNPQFSQLFVVADDSGLEVDSLGGAPGIFSARYAGENATDQTNVEKLLHEIQGHPNRAARFRCVIALARGGKLIETVSGTVEGKITYLPRGSAGFGYDPVFVPTGFDQTFAEMPAEKKNQISHRAKAVAALRQFLRRQLLD